MFGDGETGSVGWACRGRDHPHPHPFRQTLPDGPHSYHVTTDNNGYYTTTLPVGTYTMTVAAAGYITSTLTGITLITDTVTTQDVLLQPQLHPVYLPALRRE